MLAVGDAAGDAWGTVADSLQHRLLVRRAGGIREGPRQLERPALCDTTGTAPSSKSRWTASITLSEHSSSVSTGSKTHVRSPLLAAVICTVCLGHVKNPRIDCGVHNGCGTPDPGATCVSGDSAHVGTNDAGWVTGVTKTLNETSSSSGATPPRPHR